VAARQQGASQGGVFVGQVGVEGEDGCQAAIDGGGLEPAADLAIDKLVDIAKRDFVGSAVANDGHELAQVIAIVAPGAGVRISAANPVDERFDFG
jgi:hypothetical protein